MLDPVIKITKKETEKEKMEIINKLNDMLDYIKITVEKNDGKITRITGTFDIYWKDKNGGR